MPRCISSYECTARAYLKHLGSGAEITRGIRRTRSACSRWSALRLSVRGAEYWWRLLKCPQNLHVFWHSAGLKKLFASDPLLCFSDLQCWIQSRRVNCVNSEANFWRKSWKISVETKRQCLRIGHHWRSWPADGPVRRHQHQTSLMLSKPQLLILSQCRLIIQNRAAGANE